MISSLLFSCRFYNFCALKNISQQILLKNSHFLLSKNYCNNIDSTEDKLKVSGSVDQTSNAFNEIYRFPGIRLGYYLQKLKWQQTVLAAVVLPSTLVLYYFGMIDSEWTIGIILPGVMLPVNLYTISVLFQNAVGFLYISEDETTLKASYLDFWGKRHEKEFSLDDVVPFLDCPRHHSDYIYKQLEFYSSNTTKLKLFLKFGQITDKDKFDKVFGPLEIKK